MGISQWIIYAAAALAAVVCIGVVARAVWVPADVRRRCCCGGCGYALTDVASGRCPECGGALNRVGVTTPAMAVRLRGSLGWALLAWTTLFALAAGPVLVIVEMSAAMTLAMGGGMTTTLTASGVATSTGPGKTQINEQFTLAPLPAGDAGVAGDFRIDGSINAVFDAASVDSSQATLRLRINGAASDAALDLDKERGTFELSGAGGAKIASDTLDKLDAGVVKKWFDAAGVETSSAEGAVSARDALKIARMCMNDPAGLDAAFNGPGSGDPGGLMVRSRSSGMGLGGMSMAMPATATGMPMMPNPWTPGAIAGIAFGLLVYVAGVVGITWRNRRLLA